MAPTSKPVMFFEVIDNGTNQTFILTARDQSGCEETTTVNINTPTDITFSYNVGPISCDASGSGVNPWIYRNHCQ